VCLNIATLEGVMQARPGDWTIEGVKGEVYPCKPDILKRHTNRGSGIRRIGLATQSVLTVIAIWDVAELRD
jgi:hypothetical protein